MEKIRPIRIMHVIARMNVGGPAVLVHDLINSIDKTNFEVVLVTGYCEDDERDYLADFPPNFEVIQILGLGRSISPISDALAFLRLVSEIKKFAPDIVHTHTAKAGVLGRIAGLIAKPSARRIHTYHGHLLHGYFGRGKTRLVIGIEKMLGWFSHRLVSIGTNVMRDLLDVGIGTEGKFRVIFPGLQPMQVLPNHEARQQLELDQGKLYLVFVGRLTHIKRPDRLIEVIAELAPDYPRLHLLVAGRGELFDSAKAEAESRNLPITFYGWRKDIPRILSASDIAILCSDNEGIPLTLIQASQARLPIVSTNVGSVSDIVKNNENGFLVDCSSHELAQAIKKLIENEDLRLEYGQIGKNRSAELFSSNKMVEMHENLYREMSEKF